MSTSVAVDVTHLKFNEFAPEKLPGPKRKGSSSSPIIFQGRAVKLRESNFFVIADVIWVTKDAPNAE